ncbi:MAG TPA: hypothetical protein VFY25_06635, partial [Anaerolineales bacterium]|nr:hypothetical protein [Anaerolineales bacterium]
NSCSSLCFDIDSLLLKGKSEFGPPGYVARFAMFNGAVGYLLRLAACAAEMITTRIDPGQQGDLSFWGCKLVTFVNCEKNRCVPELDWSVNYDIF